MLHRSTPLPDARLTIRSTWGDIVVVASDGRVVRCDLPAAGARKTPPFRVLSRSIRAAETRDRRALNRAWVFVTQLLAGRQRLRPPMVWPGSTPFSRRAFRAMAAVRLGRTITYAELARRAGSPGGARAAGAACSRNPLPLFIPCHRVVGSSGRLGGFSGGLAWKRLLLQREGAG